MRLKAAQEGTKENVAKAQVRPQPLLAAHTPEPRSMAASLLNLERTHGNRYVQRLLAEHRQAQEEEKTSVTPDVAERIAASRSSGQPLAPEFRAEMQAFLGQDLSNVRIHSSPKADQLAREVRAEAFTAENDVFFREGAYFPSSAEGRLLLVHELTHVVQQVPSDSPSFGAEADRCADRQNAPTISRRAERLSFGETEGTTLTTTPKGEVAEERGGTVKEIDEMRAALEEVFRARIPFMTNAEIIQEALRLDMKLWKPNTEVGLRQKSAIAETLTEMYKTLSARIEAAPLDNRGLPVVQGVKWDEGSPLAGIVLDISPFGNLDLWRTFVLKPQAPPRPRRRRSRSLKLSFPDEVIVGGVKMPREFSDIARETARRVSEGFLTPKPPMENLEEGLPHFTHIGGDFVEQVGEVLEKPTISLVGVGIQIAALYWDYVHTIVQAAEQRTKAGELQGTIWTLLAANELDTSGRLGQIDDAEALIRVAEYQKERELGNQPSAYEGGPSDVRRLEQGRTTGIRETARRLAEVMQTIKRDYTEFVFEPVRYPEEESFSYQARIHAWLSRRRAYEKLGFSFGHPEVEVQLFQRVVLQGILKVAPELYKARFKLRK